jgi:hypothetical protein
MDDTTAQAILDRDDGPRPATGPRRAAHAAAPRDRLRRALRSVGRHAGVIAVFALPGVLFWWHLWAHPSSAITCACSDAEQQVWFVAWPAYALSHGLNPFFSHLIWAPDGVNLLDNASMPLVGLVLAPVTWLWGPLVATKVAVTLAPALSAWGCWIACRHFTQWKPVAWLAGLFFGYSPWVISSLREGHLGMAVLVVPPLVLVVLDRAFAGDDGAAWRWGLALALLAVVQFFLSAEVLVMTVIVSIVGTVTALIVGLPRVRAHLARGAVALGVTAAVAVVVLAVPVHLMLAGPRHLTGSVWPGLHYFGNNLSSLWNPRWNIDNLVSFVFDNGPAASYVGLGALIVAGASVVAARRRSITWVLVVVVVVSEALSLGVWLTFYGGHVVNVPWLPWRTLDNWPLLDSVLPGRFAIFVDLGLALLIGLGFDALCQSLTGREQLTRPGAPDATGTGPDAPTAPAAAGAAPTAESESADRPTPGATTWNRGVLISSVVLVAVAAAVLLPAWHDFPLPTPVQTLREPPWFATAGRTVAPGSVVLTYPFPSSASLVADPMVWQARDGMRFRLAGGYAKVPGPTGAPLQTGPPDSAVHSLIALSVDPQNPGRPLASRPAALAALRRAITAWGVTDIVVTDTGIHPVDAAAVFTAVTGRLPARSHRAWVWEVRRHALSGAYDPSAASAALRACRASLGVPSVARHGPLPQSLNRCVVARQRASTR